MSLVRVGQPAPEFTLQSTKGETRLSDFKGKKSVVLFFYPKDNTPGCTAEACGFRDSHDAFSEAGAEVIGISTDSIESHERFASKHSLPMRLLSDPGGKVRDAYGVKMTLGLWPQRVTFVIDPEGIVRHVFESQLRATKHVAEAMQTIQSFARGKTAAAPAK
jgi:thioredoxin-dependent peroxiredoxin